MFTNIHSLTGKVALVSGGGRDIGRQVSLVLAQAGASVCFNYFGGAEEAAETLRQAEALGAGEVVAAQGDMTKAADVQRVVDTCTEAFGPKIDILVNVVGGLVARKTLEEMDEAFWDFVVGVNLKPVFLLTKAVLPHMGAGGAIVNFSSQAARDGGGPGALAYATGKGAVLTMTRGLAKELGPRGIRVNAVSPGMIATAFHDTFTKPEVRERVAGATPLRRQGEAREVAELVAFLASDAAAFITGDSVEINGGMYFA